MSNDGVAGTRVVVKLIDQSERAPNGWGELCWGTHSRPFSPLTRLFGNRGRAGTVPIVSDGDSVSIHKLIANASFGPDEIEVIRLLMRTL